MATRFLLRKGKHPNEQARQVTVPGAACPFFEDPARSAEVGPLLADGWRITGHIDGEPEPAQEVRDGRGHAAV